MLSEIIWNAQTLIPALALAIPIVAIIGTFWFKLEKTKSDNQLKLRMVERGMTVEEIERVLAAKGSKVD
jgi:hypothetical protein